MSINQTDGEREYMALADGVGIIPVEFRNRAFEKLGIEPGTGGLGEIIAAKPAATSGTDTMKAFLAGVAAGADPKELAQRLEDDEKPVKRQRATRGEAS